MAAFSGSLINLLVDGASLIRSRISWVFEARFASSGASSTTCLGTPSLSAVVFLRWFSSGSESMVISIADFGSGLFDSIWPKIRSVILVSGVIPPPTVNVLSWFLFCGSSSRRGLNMSAMLIDPPGQDQGFFGSGHYPLKQKHRSGPQ